MKNGNNKPADQEIKIEKNELKSDMKTRVCGNEFLQVFEGWFWLRLLLYKLYHEFFDIFKGGLKQLLKIPGGCSSLSTPTFLSPGFIHILIQNLMLQDKGHTTIQLCSAVKSLNQSSEF